MEFQDDWTTGRALLGQFEATTDESKYKENAEDDYDNSFVVLGKSYGNRANHCRLIGQAQAPWSRSADIEDAQDDLTKLQEYIDSDECGWTLSHCLFANMGGFVIREHAPKRSQSHGDKSSQPTDQNQGGTETTSNFAVDGSPSHSSDFPNHANSSETPPEQKIELESSQALTPSPSYHLVGPGFLHFARRDS